MNLSLRQQVQQGPGPRAFNSVGWALLLLAALSLLAALTAQPSLRFFFYNADALYLPALIKDILSGAALQGWKLPPAPYFFPDLPLFFLFQVLLGDFRPAVLAYSLAQAAGLGLAWQALGRAALKENARWLNGWFPAALGLLLALAASGRFNLFLPAALSAHHTGTLLTALLALACLAAWLTSPHKVFWLVLAGLLVFLGTASDSLLVLQFVLPVGLAALLLGLARRTSQRQIGLLLLVLLAAAAGGLAVGGLLPYPSLSPYLSFSPAGLRTALLRLADWVGGLWIAHPFLCLLWAAGFLAAWAAWFTGWHRQAAPAFLLACGWLALLAPLNLAGLALSGSMSERQYLAAVIVPAFFSWPFLAAALRMHLGPPYRWVALMALLAAVVLNLPALNSISNILSLAHLMPVEVSCLDGLAAQFGLKAGLGDYWQARTFTLFSQLGVRVAPVNDNLTPQHWVGSLSAFEGEFQFAVIDEDPRWGGRLNEDLIRQRFGPPAEVYFCPNSNPDKPPSKVLLYNRPADSTFRRPFANYQDEPTQ